MNAALVNRRTALLLAGCGFAAVFATFILLERPGLGIGNFFYAPVCLVALATDALVGALAGLFGAGLFALAMVVDPRIPSHDALAYSTGIRALTLAVVGGVIGVYASRNRELLERLHDHATRDFVTGAYNVRAFDEQIRGRFEARTLFTLALVDVDELRLVNDIHGHRAGDDALRRVATALQEVAGPADAVARVGGDEFALLTDRRADALPDLAGELNALLAADNLRVTVGGLAATDAETADDLFKKADDRLFAAKLVRPNRRALTAV